MKIKDIYTPDWISAEKTITGRVSKRCSESLKAGVSAHSIADQMNQNLGYDPAQKVPEGTSNQGPITSNEVMAFAALYELQQQTDTAPLLSSADAKKLQKKAQKRRNSGSISSGMPQAI